MANRCLLLQMEKQEFLQLKLDHLCELLAAEQRNNDGETDIFERVLNWVEHTQLPDVHCWSKLLKNIRIESLEAKCILDNFHILSNSSSMLNRMQAVLRTHLKKPAPSGTLFTIGHQSDTKKIIIEKYCFTQNSWTTWMELKRDVSNFSAICINTGIIIVGGLNEVKPSNEVIHINFTTGQCCVIHKMSLPRVNAAVIANEDYIFILGGFINVPTNKVPSMKIVERIALNPNMYWDAMNEIKLHESRYGAGVVLLDECIYLIGGYNEYSEAICTVECFDTIKNLSIRRQSMSGIRHLHGVAALNGLIYAIGGSSGALGALSTVERYNPKNNIWTKICNLNRARKGLGCVVYENRLLAVGGFREKTIEEYKPDCNIWKMQDAELKGTYQHLIALAADNNSNKIVFRERYM